ncbi:hypothetical protein E4U57_003966 [Claviceps arundinis]|uniref:DUF2293 domain-containing protein n=1 Tax=Claviceps arundinis TaxID=1623583 RepID=A0ABQ7PN26_9HYPO|nr:hypothetical protein E4U57_003966 [Claviceps arundinis]
MGREKRKAILPAGASGAKERHKRVQRAQFDSSAPIPERLVAKPSVPKSKHHTYFEFVENKEKKKKLEVQVTRNKTPPPGFEFVPIGNPVLTSACKELSRERDAMIFIVSNVATNCLSQQVNRLGHHVRQTIVEAARESIAHLPQSDAVTPDGKPEPIPISLAEYHAQADAALRDLFPRIPNTDRQIIIEHAFTRVSILPHVHLQCSLTNRTISQRKNGKAEQPVGFSDDIPLARRVQLAVLAHIRHVHTRYDELLKEAGYQMARRAVEELCLDIIVKWRGDEETGRDQLDEILREVVIISDSEGDDSDAETTDDSSVEDSGSATSVTVVPNQSVPAQPMAAKGRVPSPEITAGPSRILAQPRRKHLMPSGDRGPESHSRKDQRGFKRYRAWQDAILRNREPGVQRSDFISGDNGEYDPLHPQIHMETRREGGQQSPMTYNDGGSCRATGFQVGNSMRARCSPSLLPHRMGTAPSIVPYTAESQPPGNGSYLLAHGHATNGAPLSSRQMPPPTHRLRDLLVPSIEGASPETMKPAFVRSVPPRQLDPVDNLHSRAQEAYHHPSSIPSMEAFREGMARPGGQRVTRDHLVQRLQPVNASRPGTRSNPIVMEDRGQRHLRKKYLQQRILIEARLPLRSGSELCMKASKGGRALRSFHFLGQGPSHTRRDSANSHLNILATQQMCSINPPLARMSQFSNGPDHIQSRGGQMYKSKEKTHQPLGSSKMSDSRIGRRPYIYSEQSQSQDRNHVYRLHGKRPADDDHYYYSAQIRRPRPRHSEDVIVLD